MGRISKLDQITVNSIAAGEVVERPASVVKELCENAIDAGASQITVEIWQGGIRSIQVTDNGSGMDSEDALQAFEAHATSKLHSITDLEDIRSMGFRGEALPSIASVSKVTLETRQPGETAGTRVRIEGGTVKEHGPCGTAEGTRILVEDLFYNTPARFKFLKKDSTEAAKITEAVNRLVLACPDISFLLRSNGKVVLHSPGNADLGAAIYTVLGREAAQNAVPVEQLDNGAVVKTGGMVGKPSTARRSRAAQYIFINGRYVQSPLIVRALDEAYSGLLMKGEYALAVLKIELPPNLLDVNVHPQKLEVRFWNESQVFSAVYHAVRDTLYNSLGPRVEESETEEEPAVQVSEPASVPPAVYEQTALPAGLTLLEETAAEAAEGEQDSGSVHAPDKAFLPSESPDDKGYPINEEKAVNPAWSAGGREPEEPSTEYEEGSARETPTAEAPVSGMTRNPELIPLLRARISGTLFDTYIILEEEDNYYLIDQHAAHEKILFEQLMNRPDGPIQSQLLISGEVIRVSDRELALLEQEKAFFEELGFLYDRFGDRDIVLRAVPMNGLEHQGGESIRAALDEMLQSDGNLGLKANRRELYLAIATRACKAAIKAHDKITPEEIRVLLQDLVKLENPYQCPHGRPVIIRSNRKELEKRFRRIV